MRFIARFAMRGPWHAALATAAAYLGSLAIGILIIVAGGLIALSTLRHGSREGLKVLGFSTALAVALQTLISAQGVHMLVLCLVVGLPAWILAVNLARTKQQASPLLLVAALVCAYAAAMRIRVGDVNAFWLESLNTFFAALEAQGGASFGSEQIGLFAAQMHTWSLVGMFWVLAATILLARWWQSVLFNPGGFGSEFREFQLPKFLLAVTAVTAAVFVLRVLSEARAGLAGDVFVVVVVLFAVQGLAVIHARARQRSLAHGWFVGLYILLVMLPQFVGPVLATTGVFDRMVNYRGLGSQQPADRDSNNLH